SYSGIGKSDWEVVKVLIINILNRLFYQILNIYIQIYNKKQ
ncbi:MAG: hypothetical protein ACJAT4_001115, partial [Granulosicoccus sp.]